MSQGYTRQSAASIVPGNSIQSGPLNTEFNAIQSAFAANTGHAHDGSVGAGGLVSVLNGLVGANSGYVLFNGTNSFSTTTPTLGNVVLRWFSPAGSYLYLPTTGMRFVLVFLTGAGGSGSIGNASAASISGSAGETAIGLFTAAQVGGSQSITVGAGFTPTVAPLGGNPSQFGSLLTANGALACTLGNVAAGNTGGSGGTGTGFHFPGGNGGQSSQFPGAASFWGAGGTGGFVANAQNGANGNGFAGIAPGSGGGAPYPTSSFVGGKGADGACVIVEFC